MITTKQAQTSHPIFDRKEFEIEVTNLKKWGQFFAGQPAVLVSALRELAKTRPSHQVTGEEIRKYLEANRKRLFPGTSHKDVLRIWQIYHAHLERAQLISRVAA